MAFQPRQYPLVQPPQPADPLQSLSQLMYAARNMQAFQDESKERARTQRVEKAMNDAKGDPLAAAGMLEKAGDFATGRTLRDNAASIQQRNVDALLGRVDQYKTIYGQGAQMLKEVEAHPELYPQVRPKLVELASGLDARLGAEIPETYDPERVRGMLQFVEGGAVQAERQAEAVAALKAAQEAGDDRVKRVDLQRTAVTKWLESGQGTAEDRDATLGFAGSVGILPEVVESFKGWTPKKESALPTLDARINQADRDGNVAEYKRLLAVKTEVEAAGRAPKEPKEKDEDPTYARDRQEYADYVRAHDKQQEGRTQPATDPATGRPSRFLPPQPMPYEAPAAFEVWRARAKARGPMGEAVTATPPRQERRLPGRDRRAAVLRSRGRGVPPAGVPAGPAQSEASRAPASQVRPPASAAPSMPTTQTAIPAASETRQNVAIGSDVMYQGKRYRVKGIAADGQLELEPAQ